MPSGGSLQQRVWLQSGRRAVSPVGSYGIGKIIGLCVPPSSFRRDFKGCGGKVVCGSRLRGKPRESSEPWAGLRPGCGEGCRPGWAGMKAAALIWKAASWPAPGLGRLFLARKQQF